MSTGYALRLCAIQEAELGKNGVSWLTMKRKWQRICLDVLDSARSQGYGGYSKFDALNSPLLDTLSFDNKWLRFVYTQLVNHCPFHIRPLLGVRKSRNPKGIALFVRAYLFLYSVTDDERYKGEAEKLVQWLMDNKAEGATNSSWGYNFVWQNTMFLQGMNEPNCVVSIFVGEALVHAYRVLRNEEFLHEARGVANFIMRDLPVLEESADEIAIGYVMRGVSSIVLNINALAGAFLAKVWAHTQEPELLRLSGKLVRYTVNRRTPYDAWYYSHPKEKSPIGHDNYHTGMILDALLEYYEETEDEEFLDVYWNGLEYYQTHLFEWGGAPRWMSNKKYPHDIHGAAQGIISFCNAARYNKAFLSQAERIAEWTISYLYRDKTRDFAYRRGRFMTWDYSLMRWCNAWMARALGAMVSVV